MGHAARVRRILRELRPYGPERVILFGSAARGESDPHSDVDLILIKRTRKPFLRRLVEVARLVTDLRVDLFVYTPEEFERMRLEGNPFIERVLKEGRVVYGR